MRPRPSPDPLEIITIVHPGLPGGQIQARFADLRALYENGLIEPADETGTSFTITDLGNAYFDEELKER